MAMKQTSLAQNSNEGTINENTKKNKNHHKGKKATKQECATDTKCKKNEVKRT